MHKAWKFHRLVLIATVLAVNLFVAALLAYTLNEARAQIERDVAKNVENLSMLLDQSITGSVGRIDLSLRGIGDRLQRDLRVAGRLDGAEVEALLANHRAWLSDLAQLRVTDAAGVVRFGPGSAPGANTVVATISSGIGTARTGSSFPIRSSDGGTRSGSCRSAAATPVRMANSPG